MSPFFSAIDPIEADDIASPIETYAGNPRLITPRGITPIKAKYCASPIKSHAGNPLIEALPPIKKDTEWLQQLLCLPAFDPAQVEQEAYLRAYYVPDLKDFFQPTARHLVLARRLDLVIRNGYRHRHPFGPKRAKILQQQYDAAQNGAKGPVTFDEKKPICSMSLIGISGGGKSTTTEAILAAYPQYIFHPDYDLHQIVWLKVECPRDGSIKELALNILRAFEAVLGVSLVKPGAKPTATSMLAKAKQLAIAYSLGALVLDELQNLNVKKSGGREEMLNWLQELVNELRIPVVFLGTFKATSVMGVDLRHARRTSAVGRLEWKPLPFDEEWKAMVRTLWGYQWLKLPGLLDDEMQVTLHAETQGVRALLVDMFLVSQLHAMRGDECVTPKLFKKVARTEFAAVQPMLNALRSGDPRRLMKFEDIASYDIDELMRNERLLVERTTHKADGPEQQAVTMVARAIANLRSSFGLPDKQAREFVEQVNDGTFSSPKGLTMAATRAYIASQPPELEATEL